MANISRFSIRNIKKRIKRLIGANKESELSYIIKQLELSVYNYKIVYRNAIIAHLSELVFMRQDLKTILKNRKKLNRRMKYMIIINDFLYFKDLPWEHIKNFLYKDMFRIINPPTLNKTNTRSIEDNYPDTTKDLFIMFTNTIATMQKCMVSVEELIPYKDFVEQVNSYMFIQGWKQLISELIYNKLKPNDDVTKYFTNVFTKAEIANPNTIKKMILWMEKEKLPSILMVKNDKLLVSSAYENDCMVLLPYIFCKLDLGYADMHLRDKMVYTCFHYQNQTM
ncbi:MAG: hypothetical protein HFE46_04580 [Clostridia bacterium]|nr:hypothetical protein [Clostridia bacterium]